MLKFLIMDKIIDVDVDPRQAGRQVAKAGSEDQAAFFDGWADGFQQFAQGDKDGSQMLWIKAELSQRAKDFIKKFAEYINEGE